MLSWSHMKYHFEMKCKFLQSFSVSFLSSWNLVLGLGLRLQRSDLNSHKFVIGQSETSECMCHSKHESSQHYLLGCFLYSCERQILFNRVEHFIPNFLNLVNQKKIEILITGLKTDNPEFNNTNTSISIAVQNFILKTKRFSDF